MARSQGFTLKWYCGGAWRPRTFARTTIHIDPMKLVYTILPVLCAGLLFTGCQQEEAEEPTTQNNGGTGGTGGTFTPPTTSYWKINGTANSESMDAVSVSLDGTNLGVSKPFTDMGYGYCQLRIFANGNDLNIRDLVPEGGYRDFPVKTGTQWNSGDTVEVEMDVEDGNTGTQGMYFYRVDSGTLHVSKLNGKLRYTSAGVYTMSGVKYPDMQTYTYTCQLEFSQVQP